MPARGQETISHLRTFEHLTDLQNPVFRCECVKTDGQSTDADCAKTLFESAISMVGVGVISGALRGRDVRSCAGPCVAARVNPCPASHTYALLSWFLAHTAFHVLYDRQTQGCMRP